MALDFMHMKFEMDFDLGEADLGKSDGQVSVKLPKEMETRFKILNVKYDKKLSKVMRKALIKLIESVEASEQRSA